jgi:hypothetical protein
VVTGCDINRVTATNATSVGAQFFALPEGSVKAGTWTIIVAGERRSTAQISTVGIIEVE